MCRTPGVTGMWTRVIGIAAAAMVLAGSGNILTTLDLDECHGIWSADLGYHYVMTQDFPDSVSRFRAQPTRP